MPKEFPNDLSPKGMANALTRALVFESSNPSLNRRAREEFQKLLLDESAFYG
ncbi:MAG TPA: hypothetical protein VEI07_15635 [Planctomycetaceae bacterium]|nr:hypothetical protein [Planctomycetaceae bacterium]